MKLHLGLGFTRAATVSGGPPPVDYEAEVEALLSGTPGFVTDPADTSIVFTDTGATTPVSAPGVDTVARFNTKFGTTVYNCQTASAPARYLWNGASFQLDGVDDLLSQANTPWPAGMTALTYTTRVVLDDLSVENALLGLSTSVSTVIRLLLRARTNGSLGLYLRRLDADAQQDFFTSAGVVTEGVEYTIQFSINYLNGAIEMWVDGVSVFTGTLTGTDGVNGVSPTNSVRWRDSLNPTNTLNDWFDGKLGCQVMAVNQVLDASGLAICRGFVERNPL